MAWTLLPTDYTDASWSGLKKYSLVNNSDGTVSLQDVTVYTGKEKSFFGSADANRMNEALNSIMSALENGTDLYEAFQNYFTAQKSLFETKTDEVIEDVRTDANADYDTFKTYLAGLQTQADDSLTTIETGYSSRMANYEAASKTSFDSWFANVKSQLGTDAAGNLQNEVDELDERLSLLEYMIIKDDVTAPLAVESATDLLVDDSGYAILSDWKY